MTDVYNFDGYQIPHVGLNSSLGGVGGQQNRALDMRMSNFGALRFGNRSATDYTMIANEDKDITELQNPHVPTWASDNQKNPLLVGSTRKYTRDDEFTVMGIGNRRSNSATDAPGMDVMDTNLVTDDGTNAPKNFPTEGWRSFGARTTGHNYTIPGYRPDVDMTLTASGTVMPA